MKKLIFILTVSALVGCGSDTFQTTGGTEVTYLQKGDGESPVDSLVSLFHIKYTQEDGKILMESQGSMPLKIDPNTPAPQGELFEVFKLLKVGDSVSFDLDADELFTMTFKAPRPDSIPSGSKISFQIGYEDQVTEEEFYELVSVRQAKASEKQLAVDLEIIDTYLEENSIEAQSTESGIRYVITQEGSGPNPTNGQRVKVDYTGWILNGDYFDSSNEEVAKEKGLYNERREYQPYEFPIGRGEVIRGWDEGIALLNEGAKARLYIPSTLGYGASNRSAVIRPNSILVFDVELVDIDN